MCTVTLWGAASSYFKVNQWLASLAHSVYGEALHSGHRVRLLAQDAAAGRNTARWAGRTSARKRASRTRTWLFSHLKRWVVEEKKRRKTTAPCLLVLVHMSLWPGPTWQRHWRTIQRPVWRPRINVYGKAQTIGVTFSIQAASLISCLC